MHLYPVVVGPTNVCLSAVMMVEVGQNASSISGYFVSHPPPSHIGNGADVWFPLDQNNYWPSSWDNAVLGPADVPAPWSAGSFTWVIPSKWTVVGSNVTNAMTGWSQVFSIVADGTATVQKFGHSLTRTTNDVSTTD
jgi:hypothetical protein